MKTYWHFAAENKKLGYGDNRKIRVGVTHKVKFPFTDHEGKIWQTPTLCHAGLHASSDILDALQYTPGPILCKVQLGGVIVVGNDKVVASERKVIAMADVSNELRLFARRCALDVIHLWDAPEIVVRYLKTGDESIRREAWAAARDAAWDATRAAARYAARDAARDAARHTWATAKAAARDAAWDAAWDATGAATRDAARKKQKARLLRLIRKANWETA